MFPCMLLVGSFIEISWTIMEGEKSQSYREGQGQKIMTQLNCLYSFLFLFWR